MYVVVVSFDMMAFRFWRSVNNFWKQKNLLHYVENLINIFTTCLRVVGHQSETQIQVSERGIISGFEILLALNTPRINNKGKTAFKHSALKESLGSRTYCIDLIHNSKHMLYLLIIPYLLGVLLVTIMKILCRW